jgi:hypothetical protein
MIRNFAPYAPLRLRDCFAVLKQTAEIECLTFRLTGFKPDRAVIIFPFDNSEFASGHFSILFLRSEASKGRDERIRSGTLRPAPWRGRPASRQAHSSSAPFET